jgi:cytochrome c oxidase subunit 2
VYLQVLRAHLWQFLTLFACAAAAFAIGNRPSSAQTAEPRIVEVTARRFAFEPSQIEATVGERLQLVVRSADGVHGVEIKKLRLKKEVPRGGEAVTIDFTATAEGSFPILCSEFCGKGHEDMKGMLIVRSASGASR